MKLQFFNGSDDVRQWCNDESISRRLPQQRPKPPSEDLCEASCSTVTVSGQPPAWPDPTRMRLPLPFIHTALQGTKRSIVCNARVEIREIWAQVLAPAAPDGTPMVPSGFQEPDWRQLQASNATLCAEGTAQDLFHACADQIWSAQCYLSHRLRAIETQQSLRGLGEVQAVLQETLDVFERSPKRSLPLIVAMGQFNAWAEQSALALFERSFLWAPQSDLHSLARVHQERQAFVQRVARWGDEASRLSDACSDANGRGLLPCLMPAQPTVVAPEEEGARSPSSASVHSRETERPEPLVTTQGHSIRARLEQSSAYKDLERLIGLREVKQHLKLIVGQVVLAEVEGRPENMPSMHLLLTGNPGTGKTSVARLYGRLLAQLGLLSEGHVVEASRADLVGEYLGHSEKRTQEKIDMAQGGVLFVDEAHQLVRKGGHHDYGLDVLQTLVPAMENLRGAFVVIFACYAGEEASFLRLDQGLKDRISAKIRFPDYTNEELASVLMKMAQDRRFMVPSDLAERVAQALGKSRNSPEFGNARLVRRHLDTAIARRAMRIIETEQDQWFDRDGEGQNILRWPDFSDLLGPEHAGSLEQA